MEVGPWRMDGKGGLKRVEGGWDEYAHVLYRESGPLALSIAYSDPRIISS